MSLMDENVKRVCRQICNNDITFSDGAKACKISLATMKRKVTIFKTLPEFQEIGGDSDDNQAGNEISVHVHNVVSDSEITAMSMNETVKRVCRRICNNDTTLSDGAKECKISLATMKRKVVLFKALPELHEIVEDSEREDSDYKENENDTEQEDDAEHDEESEADYQKESETEYQEEMDGHDEYANAYQEETADHSEEIESEGEDQEEEREVEPQNNNTFCPAMEFDANDFTQLSHFLCNVNTVNDLVTKIAKHCDKCTGKVVPFKQYVLPKGHIGYSAFFAFYKCFSCNYTIQFCPSPVVNGRPISDYIVLHSKVTAGGLWKNTERFTESLGFSSDFKDVFIWDDFDMNEYCNIVHEMAEESMRTARNKVIVEGNKLDGLLDAAHHTRTNSTNSTVTMISPNTLQVLYSGSVHYTEEPVSQKHEAVGTRKICNAMKRDGFQMRAGSCDAGSSSTKVMTEEFPETFLGNLDPYHGLKSDKKVVEPCTKGKLSDHGKTWHTQLSEKCGPLLEHLRHAINESSISVEQFSDPEQRAEGVKRLQARVLLPLRHYRNIHDKCSNTSRCNVDPKYRPSRTIITDDKALKILERTLTSTQIFRQAHKYLLNMPTSMNESYHNRQNKYFSKRTCLSARMYTMMIELAVLDHNENEDGVFENGKRLVDLPLNEEGLPKQPIQSTTFIFNIWQEYMRRCIV